ncbi:MAG TPA: hypothetical protein VF021_05180 [Longimicrobiales bacterium]
MDRRQFVHRLAAGAATSLVPAGALRGAVPSAHPRTPRMPTRAPYNLPHIPNEYSLLLPGEAAKLAETPLAREFLQDSVVIAPANAAGRRLHVGDELDGWRLVALLPDFNGADTAVLERHVTHRGVIVYVTRDGEIARIPKGIGELSSIRPRPVAAPPEHRFERPKFFTAQPDRPGEYILNSDEDPSYENVAALGAEYVGWTLVANEEAGPERSLFLEADGKSRQFGRNPQSLWAPDLTGRQFDPRRFLPSQYLYEYVPGYSKRTLLGGYLPAADIGVWNPAHQLGYEVMMILPPGAEATPIARVRAMVPKSDVPLIPAGDTNASQALPDAAWVDRYWNGTAADFFGALVGIWNRWQHFHEDHMRVEIPDPWLLEAARAGITLARCSYKGYEPTYQVGEGAYTKMPVRSHALFPVAHYEFVWAQQLWNLSNEVEPYFEYYLSNYILPDGNFLYNTQDQVEAPLNCGVFLENSARAFDYTGDVAALQRRLPTLRRMIEFVERRYHYSLSTFPEGDRRRGLIWGSPEADLGEPRNDYPESHPWYYQNAVWTWRGLHEHARVLARAGGELRSEAVAVRALANEMRAHIERSLRATLDARSAAMKQAGITPFHPFDTDHQPEDLNSYENHRFMMDWWTADWGDAALDEGHFRHRTMAGEQLLGMNTDGHYPRTSNFMEHGTLAGRIRQDDYRPFLMALYGNLCYAMDSGSRYAPEDALLPGSFPGEGSPYSWSAVINSTLQPAMGLRWLLCYEEHDPLDGGTATVHLQKAAPRHWFGAGQRIAVQQCPTRFGELSWQTVATASGWRTTIEVPRGFDAHLRVHIHPADGRRLRSTSRGRLEQNSVLLSAGELVRGSRVVLDVS